MLEAKERVERIDSECLFVSTITPWLLEALGKRNHPYHFLEDFYCERVTELFRMCNNTR